MTDIKSLGYITIQTSDIDRWRTFAFDVLGFALGNGPDPDALYLRMDERFARIVVVPGDTDQVVHIGWEVRDGAALQRVRESLERGGIAVKPLSVEEADARRVEDVIAFTDPTGTTTEVFFGPALDHSPVVTPFGATFVTGRAGPWPRGAADDGPGRRVHVLQRDVGLPAPRCHAAGRAAGVRPVADPVLRRQRTSSQHGVVSRAARRGARTDPHHGRGRLAGRGRASAGSGCQRRLFAVVDTGPAHQRQDG